MKGNQEAPFQDSASCCASTVAPIPPNSSGSFFEIHPDRQGKMEACHFSHLKMTTSSGSLLSLLLMKRSRCFWCIPLLWCTWVSTWQQARQAGAAVVARAGEVQRPGARDRAIPLR